MLTVGVGVLHVAEPLDTSKLGPIKLPERGRITRCEELARTATKERFKHRLSSMDQRNGYEVGYCEALLAEDNQKRRMREAMQEFCNRVDKGEVRSKRTYAKFKDILNG